MTLSLYVQCFAVAFLGMLLQTILKIKSIQDKARRNNVMFGGAIQYFKEDWLSMSASIVTIVLFMFFIDEFTTINAHVMDYLKIGFGFVGYTGSDLASRLFSVVNRKVNNAIDYKTTIADTATGTLDQPTPAMDHKNPGQ